MGGEPRSGGPHVCRWATLVAAVVVLGLLVPGLTACKALTETDTQPTSISLGPVTTLVTETIPTPTERPATGTTASPVSQESRDYAESLGGTSHKGEKLYFVIGASVRSEAQARSLLEPAKAVGDMQSYFIVQSSDNFDGMTPGYWVVFEAYRAYPSQDNIDFDRRPFPDAYVKSAVVLTDDPIPVYEDMVGD